jgi:SAM-dependent methyltransferase
MIAVAKKRAAASGLQNVETRVTKGETFDLPDDSVDAVLCRWGLMFFPEPSKQLTDIRRLLKPAGRFAAAVWAAPPKVPMLSAPMIALGKALGLPPPPPGPSPFALADASKLEQLLRGVGFGDVQIDEQTIDFTYDSMDQYMESLVDLAAPVTALLAAHGARRDELLSIVRDAMKRFVSDDGAIVLPNTVVYACAQSPSH